MRQQMKTLEQKNEMYMQQTISLEEDSKRANALKNQVKNKFILNIFVAVNLQIGNFVTKIVQFTKMHYYKQLYNNAFS